MIPKLTFTRRMGGLLAVIIVFTSLLPQSGAVGQAQGSNRMFLPWLSFSVGHVQEPGSFPSEYHTLPKGGTQFYAAPTGTINGDGSKANPWNLETALNQSRLVKPGDVINLRGGRYGNGGATQYTARLMGQKDHPIVVRQYPGERAIVDGGIHADGQYTWFWGFEITNSLVNRTTDDTNHPPGLYLMGLGHKAINLVVYNTGHPGIGFWRTVGDGGEIYGCIIYGVGTYDTERDGTVRGSAIYAQNQDGTHLIRDVISFRNFKTGMKAYSEAEYVNGFTFEGNISFENGDRLIFVSGRDHPVERLRLINNYTYRAAGDINAPVRLGYPDVDQMDALIRGNYFVNGTHTDGAFWVKRFRDLTVTGNVFVSSGMLATNIPSAESGTQVWDRNQYYGGAGSPFRLGAAVMNWATWKSRTGFDNNSSYSTGRPKGVNAFVRPNLYDPNRANIVIYNWDKKALVSIDLSDVLSIGQHYEIRDAQNYFGSPAAAGNYAGSPVSIPMNLTAVSEITGSLPFANVHTSPEFGAFVLIKLP